MTFIFAVNPGEEATRCGDADVAKAIVMTEIVRLVENGHASFARHESGRLELRFTTGEIFHLGEKAVTRIA
jgi:hypothetical protein